MQCNNNAKRYKDMKASKYNKSEIMKAAHNMYRTGNYKTFGDALRKSWKVAKFRVEIEARRTDTLIYMENKKKEEAQKAAWIAKMEAERQERFKRMKSLKVEEECRSYGYGLGNHYSMFSGWGNYCGD